MYNTSGGSILSRPQPVSLCLLRACNTRLATESTLADNKHILLLTDFACFISILSFIVKFTVCVVTLFRYPTIFNVLFSNFVFKTSISNTIGSLITV